MFKIIIFYAICDLSLSQNEWIPITAPPIPKVTETRPAIPDIPQNPNAPNNPIIPSTTSDMIYGAYGQLCRIRDNLICLTSTTSASNTQFMNCERDYSCCLCQEITCNDCIAFTAGNYGAYNVQSITINGRPSNIGGNTEIVLSGTESAMNSVITGTNIKDLVITGNNAAKNAKITINNPMKNFRLFCTGLSSCEGLIIEIIIPPHEPGKYCAYNPFDIHSIDCSGSSSCKNMQLTINNKGCNPLIIDNILCTQIDSCSGANFNFIGDIETINCDLGASGHSANGLSSCYQNLQVFLCQDPNSCRNIQKTLVNPSTGFSLECIAMGSCQGAHLYLDFDMTTWTHPVNGNQIKEHIFWLSGFKFKGESSGALATIIINNNQGGKSLEIETIECVGLNACAKTTFIIGMDVQIGKVICPIGTCDGCLIKMLSTDVGIPCYDYAQL